MPKAKIYQKNDILNNGVIFLEETEPRINKKGQKYRRAKFLCKCGNTFITEISKINTGHTRSCGCYNRQRCLETHTTHGDTGTHLYNSWKGMRERCSYKKHIAYNRYGGRGISVCDEWNDYSVFKKWALNNGFVDGLSIDRKDNDGNYEPDNCRWTDRFVQTSNVIVIRSTNKSGYKGVHRYGKNNMYCASIGVKHKRIHIGVFKDKLEAARAYNNYIDENNLPHTKNDL